MTIISAHRQSTLVEFLQGTMFKLGKVWVLARTPFQAVPHDLNLGCGKRVGCCLGQEPSLMTMMPFFFPQGNESKKIGLSGKKIKKYTPMDVAAVAEWKETLCNLDSGTSIN